MSAVPVPILILSLHPVSGSFRESERSCGTSTPADGRAVGSVTHSGLHLIPAARRTDSRGPTAAGNSGTVDSNRSAGQYFETGRPRNAGSEQQTSRRLVSSSFCSSHSLLHLPLSFSCSFPQFSSQSPLTLSAYSATVFCPF